MKFRHLLILTLLLQQVAAQAQVAAPCDVNNYKPTWIPLPEFTVAYGPHEKQKVTNFFPAKMRPHLQTALNWVKSKSANVTGSLKAEHQNYYYPGFPGVEKSSSNHWFASTGLISYYNLWVLNNGIFCRNNKPATNDAPADIYVRFNYVNNIIIRVTTEAVNNVSVPVTINNKPIYQIPLLKRSEGNVDYYQFPGPPTPDVANFFKWEFIDAYIIRNSDQPFFIPVTRKEYLEAYLNYMSQAYKRRQNMALQHTVVQKPEEIDAALQKRIEEIKRLTEQGAWGYSKESMAHRIKVAEEHFRNLKDEEANKIKNLTKKIDDDYNATQQFIQDYLKKTNAGELRKPVPGHLGDLLVYANFDAGSATYLIQKLEEAPEKQPWGSTTQLAFINKNYFNQGLPPDIPQLIAVEIVNLDNVHVNLRQLVENINRDYDFSALKALFPGGKALAGPSTTQPTAPVKKGGNAFLPKADSLKKMSPALPPVTNPQGMNLFAQLPAPRFPAQPIRINYPTPSPHLKQLPVLQTEAAYKNYLLQLQQQIVRALPPQGQTRLDALISNKQLSSSELLSRNAFGAWLSGYPGAALYFDNKAVLLNSSDGLSANNFAVHLLKSGYPEKALPLLHYWLKTYPRNTLLLGNAANAYYYLGDLARAMQLAQQCVAVDSLHPSANKLLAFGHYKAGNKQLCKGFLERSLKAAYDEEVVALLLQLEPDADISRLLYEGRKGKKEPLLLKRFQLPAAIASIAEAEAQKNTIETVLESINATIEAIGARRQPVDMDALFRKNMQQVQQFKGIPPLQITGQAVVLHSWGQYQKDFGEHMQYLERQLATERKKYATATNAIAKRFNDQIARLQTGEGEDPRVAQLELDKCKELNQALDNYLKATAPILNSLSVRLEYISRQHYSTVANWMPHWLQSNEAADFPGTQISYLEDMRNILKKYVQLTPTDCSAFEQPTTTTPVTGELMIWEEKFCNLKFGMSVGVATASVNCNTISLSGGELLQGDLEIKMKDDWSSVEEATVAAGVGVGWKLGDKDIAHFEAGASEKIYLKFGKNKTNGEWSFTPTDVGFKGEVSLKGNIGKASMEAKVLEVSMGSQSGVTASGYLTQLPVLK